MGRGSAQISLRFQTRSSGPTPAKTPGIPVLVEHRDGLHRRQFPARVEEVRPCYKLLASWLESGPHPNASRRSAVARMAYRKTQAQLKVRNTLLRRPANNELSLSVTSGCLNWTPSRTVRCSPSVSNRRSCFPMAPCSSRPSGQRFAGLAIVVIAIQLDFAGAVGRLSGRMASKVRASHAAVAVTVEMVATRPG